MDTYLGRSEQQPQRTLLASNVYVLEINSVCSIGKNSYYELSVNAAGITMNDIFSLMLKN